jgi:HK97 family phage major capsid protein
MPFNNVIDRTDAGALIPQEVSNEILQSVTETNPLLSLARRLPNMASNQRRMPVLNALATAYFVSGDTGLKQTTEMNWANRFIDAEELAVIVPIPEAVLDDANYDIWGEVKPELVTALNVAIFQAVVYGTNIPASWTVNLNGQAGIVAGATAAGHVASIAAFVAAGGDLYDAIMSESAAGLSNGLLMFLEADGYMANGHIADLSLRGRLRGLRDSNGQPIFTRSIQDTSRYELDGESIFFPRDGSVVGANALDIAGDWTQLVYAMRQDITYKILDQAVIQDAAGNIIYNLAQQDMVALRAVVRLGFALPNPINRVNQNAATRYPFSILTA